MSTDTVLIVDDDPSALDLLCAYVDSFGFSCDRAADGKTAIQKLRAGNFTIVLADIIMPRMDGMQLLRHIREHHPHIGVIMITGGQSFSYTGVIKAGASDFITKPFSADELEAKLNRLVRELDLIRQLKQHSIHDALTGLHNRRYFDGKILSEAQRAERQGYKIFLMMIDIDDLKRHNDKQGHQGGDYLLRTVGGILQQSIRESVDWAFRYGGDEFGVVFAQLEVKQALQVAERIQEKYRGTNFSGTGLSMGIARFIRRPRRTWQEDIANLVARADRALYEAKNGGKGQVRYDEDS